MRKKNELKILATGEQYIKDDDKRKIIERWFDCSNILTGQLHMCNKKWVDVPKIKAVKNNLMPVYPPDAIHNGYQ